MTQRGEARYGAAVEVLNYVPGGWCLLRDGEHHYLSVSCHLPMVDVSMLLQLTPEEEVELHALGNVFTDYLASKVAYWTDRYWVRNLNGEISAEVTAAIVKWRAEHES